MMYAIDRAFIVKSILNGEAQVINSPILGPAWVSDIPRLNQAQAIYVEVAKILNEDVPMVYWG